MILTATQVAEVISTLIDRPCGWCNVVWQEHDKLDHLFCIGEDESEEKGD